METSKHELLTRIADEESRLVAFERQCQDARGRLERWRQQLSTSPEQPAVARHIVPQIPAALTAIEKLRLFRGLFRGRGDVFPRLWVNPRQGRKGYAPACFNEWVRPVCQKPRVKCSECPSQAFIPVDDRVVLDHLQGRHVIGVYPLLEDETCWFLAVDFDDASWTSS